MSDEQWEEAENETPHTMMRFDLAPLAPDDPEERSRWTKCFTRIIPLVKAKWGTALVFAKGLGSQFAGARVAQEEQKANRIAKQAELLDAQAEQIRTETMRSQNAAIDEAFASDDPNAALLKLSNIASKDPGFTDQVERVHALLSGISVMKGGAFDLQVTGGSVRNSEGKPGGEFVSTLSMAIEGAGKAGHAEESSEGRDVKVEIGRDEGNLSGSLKAKSKATGDIHDAKSEPVVVDPKDSESASESTTPNVIYAEPGKFKLKGGDAEFEGGEAEGAVVRATAPAARVNAKATGSMEETPKRG